MGKKKKKEIVKPWCYYCDRVFEDEKILIQHQKAKVLIRSPVAFTVQTVHLFQV
jgi:hypothetical protein